MKWISCKEKLPEVNDTVIAYLPHYDDSSAIDILYISETILEDHKEIFSDWMPLPEPPRKGK